MNPFPRTTRSLGAGLSALALAAGSSALPASAGGTEQTFELTIKHLDRSGAVTGNYLDTLLDRYAASPDLVQLNEPDGTSRVRLPKGSYLLETTIGVGKDAPEHNFLVTPKLELTADLTLTIDARQAQPVRISVPEPSARRVFTSVDYTLTTTAQPYSSNVIGDGDTKLYTAQLGPSPAGFSGRINSEWAKPSAAGTTPFQATPYIYSVVQDRPGSFFTGFDKAVRPTELATVRPTLVAQGKGTGASYGVMPATPVLEGGHGMTYWYPNLPATPTVHVTAVGATWSASTAFRDAEQAEAPSNQNGTATSYQAGRSYSETFGGAVLGPAFPAPPYADSPFAYREGDVMSLLPVIGDSAGHSGAAATGPGTLSVTRDGSSLAEVAYEPGNPPALVTVPAASGRYRVDLATNGTGVLGTSTAVRTSWAFRSARTTKRVALPLWAVRFAPPVDDHNTLRSGPTHALPIVVEAQRDAAVGKLTTLTVQTSTDDGKTWQDAPVTASAAGKYTAVVSVPVDASSVSLRTRAADSLGNTVDETITRAYKVTR
ncbi:hypothetical protein [Kribbella monticola]|uniref:hypothetical protein n=1 Tax=Kribbella monticola TaxID=2185285 RepID=UPI000DD38834|nr:hypothetical protein [Kribbella monticola]